jgi:hypothetical protein
MKLALIVLALATAANVPAAAAQVQPFVAAGITVPAGSIAEVDEALPFGDAGLGLQVDGGIALGTQRGAVDVRIFGTYATASRDFDDFNREIAENGIDMRLDGDVRVVGAGVGAAYYFPTELLTDVFPYVLASGGVYQQRHTIDYTGDDVAPGTESDVETETRVGAAGGLGLVWAPGRLRIFLESRLQALMSAGERPGYLIPVQLGVKFGRP